MDDIKITVIIPVYNASKYLNQCLDSIISQTLKEIEIICINDASSDNSLEILNEYKKKDDRIIIINNERNEGQGKSRNKGIELAKGKYLSFVDADDYIKKDMLEETFKQAIKYEADVVTFSIEIFDNNTGLSMGRLCRPYHLREKLPCVFNAQDSKQYTLEVFKEFACNKIFRKSFIIENNIFFLELKHSEDLYFSFLSIFLAPKIIYLDEVMYYYRLNQKSSASSSQKLVLAPECSYIAIKALMEELEKHNKLNDFGKIVFNFSVKFYSRILGILSLEVYNNMKELILKDKFFDYTNYIFRNELEYDMWYFNKNIDKIMEFYNKINSDSNNIVLWGAGKYGRRFMAFSKKEGFKIDYIVDKDETKQGTKIEGVAVDSWADVRDNSDIIITTNYIFYDEILKYSRKKVFDMDSYLLFDASFEECMKKV